MKFLFIGDGKPRDREGVLLFYNRMKDIEKREPRWGLKLLVRKEDNIPVGQAGLAPQTINSVEEFEIGCWIAVPFWVKVMRQKRP
ncbi:MAG TPA: hypothetical protein VFH42_08765 [Sporolactobacillaceae bacterium]|nr:hypothetical protein [Sporolactobacillaceae bacterium]